MQAIKNAIVREPCSNFAKGLTSANLGAPDLDLTRNQFEFYCEALEGCGVKLIRLSPDDCFPDSTFVEDTAVLTEACAIIARPGVTSRRDEVGEIRGVLAKHYEDLHLIKEPGTLDAGDVCRAGDQFFIGISLRTNLEGAQQLADKLRSLNFRSTFIDIRHLKDLLHLKSGLSYIGERHLVIVDEFFPTIEFEGFFKISVSREEAYAANCVRVNDSVLIAKNYPRFQTQLNKLGFQSISLDVSEFRKMDGGLSCLSLRF